MDNIKFRIAVLCGKYNLKIERVKKSFEYLKKHSNMGEDICIVDFLEQQIKMLDCGVKNTLHGEECQQNQNNT